MRKITAANIVSAIRQLPRNQDYNYISPKTKGLIRIVDVIMPEGGIKFKRWNPANGEKPETAKVENISSHAIWRYANAFVENQPVNIDRVFGGSLNIRSVLESLTAHTPQFYYCYPGRIEEIAGQVEIKSGHKHLMWIPSDPHRNGIIVEKKVNVAISEIPMQAVTYDLVLPPALENAGIDVNMARRHTQIQIALYLIGLNLGFRTWIAQNDKGIIYNDKPLIEQSGIVKTLQDEPMVYPHDGAVSPRRKHQTKWFYPKASPAIP